MDGRTERTLITTPIAPALVRGALGLERTGHGVLPRRLPARARAQCNHPQLALAGSQPSEVRLAFRTRATVVELDANGSPRSRSAPADFSAAPLPADDRPAERARIDYLEHRAPVLFRPGSSARRAARRRAACRAATARITAPTAARSTRE